MTDTIIPSSKAFKSVDKDEDTIATNRSVIIVAGMHRSGTSAFGGLLQALGVDLPGELVAAKVDNPKGFFENERVVSFHESLLAKLASAYDDPINLGEREFIAASEFGAVDELTTILQQELGSFRLSAFKDPRACRLLPLWIEALGGVNARPLIAVPLRHPFEVAESLSTRNGFSSSHSLLLWIDHVLSAERHSRGLTRSFFRYSDLLADWQSVAVKVASDLQVTWPSDPQRVRQQVDSFLTGDLRHHLFNEREGETGDELQSDVAAVWKAMLRLTLDESDSESFNTLDEIYARHTQANSVFSSYVAAERHLTTQSVKRITFLEEHAVSMDRLARDKDESIASVHQQLTLASKQMETILQAKEAAAKERDAISKEREVEVIHARELFLNLEAARASIGQLQSSTGALASRTRELSAELEAIRRSTAWRLVRLLIRAASKVPRPIRQQLKSLVRRSRDRFASRYMAGVGQSEHRIDIISRALINPTDAQQLIASAIEQSGRFDAVGYEGALEAERMGISPVMHYILHGEVLGHKPSREFDPTFYATLYPELKNLPINLFDHFIAHGSMEGRLSLPAAASLTFPALEPSADRSTILLIAHEASRTGAPILAWNLLRELQKHHDVLVLLLGGGELVPFFRLEAAGLIGPLTPEVGRNAAEAQFVVREIVKRYDIEYVVANSVETRAYAVEFTRQMVPVVSLVHEFASYTKPKGILQELFSLSDELVFSAELVRRVSELEYEILRRRKVHILPQGPSEVPARIGLVRERGIESVDDVSLLRGEGHEDVVLVVGMGTVQHRKGVDLFISAAAATLAAAPEQRFRFVWFGHGYDPDVDVQYSAYLAAQIELSGLTECLEIRDPVADLTPVYEQADLMALTSRLDPLPNVSIDAALAGIPIVCFEHASGFADLLQADEATSELVVSHLDSTAAGQLIADLARDRARRERLGDSIRRLAMQTFQMDAYVARVAELGRDAAARARKRKRDAQLIRNEDAFDAEFYKGEAFARLGDKEALAHYLSYAKNVGAFSHAESGVHARRPAPGFHPLRFAHDAMSIENQAETDPLAEYLRRGRPAGPWTYPVIKPLTEPVRNHHDQRVALHGHFHYPDLVPELLACLETNRSTCDLFLTTNSEDGRRSIVAASRTYVNGEVEVRCVPNRGRDIAPFLTEFRTSMDRYHIVGHVHGKRSVHIELGAEAYGDRWRKFLWQHLIGPDYAMADTILNRFADDSRLGLVFPEDPHLVGWDSNRRVAEDIARRVGITTPLPDFFTFPIGTMFWARTDALRPLFDLNFSWDEYPDEPLANDGTTLHALERLFSLVADHAGYHFATTHIPGIVR